MSNITKIIARVQKLLALSENAGSDAEAANAAGRAAKLIEEYQLSEAMLRIYDHTVKPDMIVDGVKLVDKAKKRIAWKESIAFAVGKSLGCHVYLSGPDPVCYGRESATQTWNYTCQYLYREVERLTEEAWALEGEAAKSVGQSTKKWKNAFRMGAATTISVRLYDQAAQIEVERRAKVEAFTREVMDQDLYTGGYRPNDQTEHNQALVILDQDAKEVETAYMERSKNFRRSTSIGTVSSRTGYDAGKEAGKGISLGGARAGLSAGQGYLP